MKVKINILKHSPIEFHPDVLSLLNFSLLPGQQDGETLHWLRHPSTQAPPARKLSLHARTPGWGAGRAAPRTPDQQEQSLLPWSWCPRATSYTPPDVGATRGGSPEYSPGSGKEEGTSLQTDFQRPLSWAFADQFPSASKEESKISV